MAGAGIAVALVRRDGVGLDRLVVAALRQRLSPRRLVTAGADGVAPAPAEMGYRPTRALAIAHSSRLAHTVGVNDVFAALSATARTETSYDLEWWTETRCTHEWGDLARPDAYLRWSHGTETTGAFLEHDRGTEPLSRLERKLDRYRDLAEATSITTPVLIALPSPRREAHLHQRLDRRPPPDTVPLATAARPADAPGGPAAAVWRPHGAPESARLQLIDLTQPAHDDEQPATRRSW